MHLTQEKTKAQSLTNRHQEGMQVGAERSWSHGVPGEAAEVDGANAQLASLLWRCSGPASWDGATHNSGQSS